MGWKARSGSDLKENVKLSSFARRVIMGDIDALSYKNRGQYLNDAFVAFWEHADASIEYKRRNGITAYECGVIDERERIKKIIEDDHSLKKAFGDFLNYEKDNPIDAPTQPASAARHDSDYLDTWQIRINKKVVDILANSLENKHYDVGKCMIKKRTDSGKMRYYAAVIEEFTRLSFAKRKEYLFSETFIQIKQAIRDGVMIQLIHEGNGRKRFYQIRPYKIVQDANQSHNYLVGIIMTSKKTATDEWSRKEEIKSLKISRIKPGITVLEDIPAVISEEEKTKIDKLIDERGVAFITDPVVIVEVELTIEGVKRYRDIQHLRPLRIREPVDVDNKSKRYVFECPSKNVEFYFKQFGAEAKIISVKYKDKGVNLNEPEDKLTKKIIKMFSKFYAKAAACYPYA